MQPALREAIAVDMKRTLDASRLNVIANHPEVRPHIGGAGEIDLSQIIADPGNFALEVDGGGFVMQAHEGGIYEVHSLFLPEARWQTVQAMREGMRYMFCRTNCFRLLTKVPAGNVAAASLAKRGHFTNWFETPEMAFMALDLDGWAITATWADEIGREFHAVLDEAIAASPTDWPDHPDDATHDRMVGVAIEMARHGNLAKGVGMYNRWARFAMYPPAHIVSMTPPLVDIGGMTVSINNDLIEVVSCL